MKSHFVAFLLAAGCGVAVGLTREYIFIGHQDMWWSAQKYCRQYYRDLATITSTTENQQFSQSGLSSYDSWIGLYMSQSSPWEWSDGDSSPLRIWSGRSPHFVTGHEYCVIMNYQRFWFNQYCGSWRNFYCYRFLILVKEKKTWEEALQFCRTHYTGLASVTSEWSLKQMKLETVGTETESLWTGLRFMDGKWFWVNEEQPGIPLGSLVSMPPCPDLSYRCGALNTTTNILNNHNCNEKMNFVCYWA